MDWSDGYVTDLGYTHGYYKELNPLLQSYSLAAGGREAPDIKKPFVKVELGCGYGLSALIEAATFPHAQIFALDFNANHITWAKRIAKEAQLDNVTFFDASFADLQNLPIPMSDFIGLHGVWSWINQDNRDVITDFLAARLQNGGVAMISYNALPGWSESQSLREIMMRKYRSTAGTTEARIKDALSFADAVSKIDGPFFNLHPGLRKTLEDLTKKSVRYMAHEYFNHDWHQFYHHQVANSLVRAKLSFAATCKPLENFERFCFTPEFIALLNQVAPSERETVKDIYLNRNFRYDLYGRGIEKGQIIATIDRIREMNFVLIDDNMKLDAAADKTLINSVKLKNSLLGPLLERLKAGPATGSELAVRDGVEVLQAAGLAEVITLLVEAKTISVGMPNDGIEARRKATHRLNTALIERFNFGEDVAFLASPVSGFGHNLNDVERLFLSAIYLGKPPAEHALKILDRLGRRVMRGSAPIESEADSLKELDNRLETFTVTMVPKLKRLGFL